MAKSWLDFFKKDDSSNEENMFTETGAFIQKLDKDLTKSNPEIGTYLHEWYKVDGDYIEKGKPLYSVRFTEESMGINMITMVDADHSGFVQLLKTKDEQLSKRVELCLIHQLGSYERENTPTNANYFYHFDEYIYDMPDFPIATIAIKDWNKKEGDFVIKGEVVFYVGSDSWRPEFSKIRVPHYAEKDGFLDIVNAKLGNSSFDRKQNKLVYVLRDSDEEIIEKQKNQIEKQKEETTKQIKLDDEEPCYVYLMIDTTNLFHKIGISNSPYWREKTLQSEKPTIELLAHKKFINRKMATSFEKALHFTYSEKRMRGEWFNLNESDVQEIIVTLKQ